MLTPSPFKPGTISAAMPAVPTEDDYVLPRLADQTEIAITAPGAPETITPPLKILGWDEELEKWHEHEIIVGDPFVIGPDDPGPKYLLSGSVGVRLMHVRAAVLSAPLTISQRGVYTSDIS